MKTERKKIFCGASKILKTISWPINICLKSFMTPTKAPQPPPPSPYIVYVRSLTLSLLLNLRPRNLKA